MSLDSLPLIAVRWPSLVKTQGTPLDGTWRSFLDEMKTAGKFKGKDAHPGWSAVRVEPCTRKAAHVQEVSALVLDFDGGDPLDSVYDAWSEWAGLLSTTKSHTPESPRCRVILPFRSPVDAATYAKIWQWAEDRCRSRGLSPDKATKDPCRLWYLPGTLNGTPYEWRDLVGDVLDPAAILASIAPPVVETMRRAPASLRLVSDPFREANAVPIASVARWLGVASGDEITCPGCGTVGSKRDTSVAFVGNGLKCSHNRCADKGVPGKPGFRSVIDLVVEVRHCTVSEAMRSVAREYGFEIDEPPAPSWRDAPPLDDVPSVALATDAPALPVIVISTSLAEVADQAETALGQSCNAFARAHTLVRVLRGSGPPVIATFSATSLREELSRRAQFKSITKDGLASCLPPKWVAETLVERGEWGLPPLDGVIEAPSMRPDGTILDCAGYDRATGVVYVPSGEFPRVPQSPTRADALAALDLLTDPLADFPFATPADRSAAVAAILTIIARSAISGCCPAFAPDAPTPGTGKSLLADVIGTIADGRAPSRMTAPSDDTEAGKTILAMGLEGMRVVLVDNIVEPFGGAVFSGVLTSGAFTGRLLGLSRNATVPCRMVWLLTGNNLQWRGDFGRRVITITLDAARENPEDRTGFRHADLLGWVRDNRPRLVCAALTILRAYHLAGRPPHGQSRMGSFESWDDLVRSACMWAGLDDPCGGRARLREEADADMEPLRVALHAWMRAVGSRAETLVGIVDMANHDAELRSALIGICKTRDGALTTRDLGMALRTHKKRIADGMRLETDGKLHGNTRWRLVQLA